MKKKAIHVIVLLLSAVVINMVGIEERYLDSRSLIAAEASVVYRKSAGMFFTANLMMRNEISGIIDSILNERDQDKKEDLLKKLKSYPDNVVVQSWLEILDKTRTIRKKCIVIESISNFHSRRAVVPVSEYLISPHRSIRESAAKTLKVIGDDRLYPIILKMSRSSNPVHRIYFIEAMNYLYDRRFYYSLTGLLRDSNKSVRIYVINCIKQNMITEALGNVRNLAGTDKNDEVRIAAIETLGIFKDRSSVYLFNRTINDSNTDVRSETIKSIITVKSALSVNALSARLMIEKESEIKDLLLEALITIGRSGNVVSLEKIVLSDRNSSLRIKAAYVLGLARNQQALNVLKKALDDSYYRVRAEACNALGNYRGRHVVNMLLEVIEKEKKLYVKSAALYSLKKINDRSAVLGLFDIYNSERDPLFKEMLRLVIREYIIRYI